MKNDVGSRLFAESIKQHISLEGKRILEVGCGNGDLLKYIGAYYNPDMIIGIDPNLESWWNIEEGGGIIGGLCSAMRNALNFPTTNLTL
jgi:hypothetical protein